MTTLNRREYLTGTLAALSAASTSTTASARSAPPPAANSLKLALVLGPGQPDRFRLARQLGVTHAIAGVAGRLAQVSRDRYLDTLAALKREYDEAGLTIAGVESHPVDAERIKLGLPGRDEELENYVAAIRALGELGIPMICYNFMAGLGWYRTRVDVPGRGGALTSEFDRATAEAQGLTQWGEISEEQMWEHIETFLRAVIPVAEKAQVQMAAHPDDPPISPLRGIARILTSARNYRRVMNLVPSPINGVTFCQANFKAMGEDIEALAREWGAQKKIFFVHFRDIDGQAAHFRETFHDDGPTDMAAMLRAYFESGFDGPLRPDHAPTLAGESNDSPGYAMQGKIFAIGYMKGLLQGQKIPYA